MKTIKAYIIVVLLIISNSTYAQTDQGNWLIGGTSDLTMSFTKDKVKEGDDVNGGGKNGSFQLSPRVGYFVTNQLALGVSLPLSIQTYKLEEDNYKYKSRDNTMVFAPFAQYFFSAGEFEPFVYGMYGFGSQKSKSETTISNNTNSSEATYGVRTWELGAGAAYFVSNNISLDASIGYGGISLKEKEDNPDDRRDVTSGIGVNLGFTFYL